MGEERRVSEYRYYEFAAVDRPLGARDLDVLHGLSTTFVERLEHAGL